MRAKCVNFVLCLRTCLLLSASCYHVSLSYLPVMMNSILFATIPLFFMLLQEGYGDIQPPLSMLEVQKGGTGEGKVQRPSDGKCKRESDTADTSFSSFFCIKPLVISSSLHICWSLKAFASIDSFNSPPEGGKLARVPVVCNFFTMRTTLRKLTLKPSRFKTLNIPTE